MAISRVKVWVANEILTAADLNGEFNNIIDNALSLISPLTGNLNVNQNVLQSVASIGASGGVTALTLTATGATMGTTMAFLPAGIATATTVPLNNGLYANNVPKAWLRANVSGTILSEFNINGITDVTVGVLDVTWDRTFSSTNYVVMLTAAASTSIFRGLTVLFQTTNAVSLQCTNVTNTTLVDPDGWHVIAFGNTA